MSWGPVRVSCLAEVSWSSWSTPLNLSVRPLMPQHMSATGLTANGKYSKIDTNYAGKKFKILGFAPDYWAFHPTTGLCTRLLGFHPNTQFLTQIPKSPHSTDQRTFGGHFPLNPGPLSDLQILGNPTRLIPKDYGSVYKIQSR